MVVSNDGGAGGSQRPGSDFCVRGLIQAAVTPHRSEAVSDEATGMRRDWLSWAPPPARGARNLRCITSAQYGHPNGGEGGPPRSELFWHARLGVGVLPKLTVAAAVAVGYLLGRTRKMKLAIAVAGLLAGRRLKLDPQALLQQGSKLLESSPELRKVTGEFKNKLTGELSEQLLQAATAAATSAATKRVEGLTDKIRGTRGSSSSASSSSESSAQESDEEPGSTDEEARTEEDSGEQGSEGEATEQRQRREDDMPRRPRRPRRPDTTPGSGTRTRDPRK